MGVFFGKTVRYLFDPQVPFGKKWWIIFVIIYFLSPIDLIPESILGFGFLDDLVILMYSVFKIKEMLTNYEVPPESSTSRADTYDVEYKIHED